MKPYEQFFFVDLGIISVLKFLTTAEIMGYLFISVPLIADFLKCIKTIEIRGNLQPPH